MEDKEKHPEMGEQCRALLSAYWIAIRKAAPMANQYGIKSFESLVTLATGSFVGKESICGCFYEILTPKSPCEAWISGHC